MYMISLVEMENSFLAIHSPMASAAPAIPTLSGCRLQRRRGVIRVGDGGTL